MQKVKILSKYPRIDIQDNNISYDVEKQWSDRPAWIRLNDVQDLPRFLSIQVPKFGDPTGSPSIRFAICSLDHLVGIRIRKLRRAGPPAPDHREGGQANPRDSTLTIEVTKRVGARPTFL